MTTNAGAQEMSRSSIGFQLQDHTSDGFEVIKKMFTPEFRNRLDAIIPFASLSQEVIKTVVDKFLVEIQVQLDDKKVHLEVSGEARIWLAENGYDEKMGARPMQRLIQNRIKKELAEDILFGKLSNGGGVVHVTVEDGDLSLVIDEPEMV
jgi:ATP-dependent Clp protease ATP-binding subunit ClpA